MSDIKKLFSQSSHYLIGQALLMAAGFISFPILTRVLSVNDYGLLGLITSTVAIIVAIVKLGFPASIIRFYNEFKTAEKLDEFYSTMFFGYSSLALCGTLILILAVPFIPDNYLDANIRKLLSIASTLVFLSCVDAIITSFLRAAQKSKSYILINIIIRYGTFISGIMVFILFMKNLYGFYIGTIFAHLLIAGILVYVFLRRQKVTLKNISSALFKKSLRFGVFLAGSDIGNLMLIYADRYFIQFYLGSQLLGIYTAGYNLAMYTVMLIMSPVNIAIDPIYLSIFSKKGAEETRIFLTKALRYFLLVLIPVVIGFIAVGKDFLAIMASSKYIDAFSIMPYIIIGYGIYALLPILNAGLFIQKKTYIFMIMRIIATVLNLGLNILLIPKYGILGAAQATLISYIFYTVVITYFSFRELSFRIDYSRILLYSCMSVLMFLIIKDIDLGSHLTNLISKIGTGVLVYSFAILLFDREIKNKVFTFAKSYIRYPQ